MAAKATKIHTHKKKRVKTFVWLELRSEMASSFS